MEYLTAMASSPLYEFPYTHSHELPVPQLNDNINQLLSNITPSLGDVVYNQPPVITLQCVPQISYGTSNNTSVFQAPSNTNVFQAPRSTSVYQVPENMPIDTILQQFGIDMNTLSSSNSVRNYYRSASQPLELIMPPSSNRHRRLVCREVSDIEDDYYSRSSNRRQQNDYNSRPNRSQQSPAAIHSLLGKVWEKAKSAPDLNSQRESTRNRPPSPRRPPSPSPMSVNNAWQSMRNAPSSPNMSANNAWQSMRNAPSPPNMSANNAWQSMRNAPSPPNMRANNAWQSMRNAPRPPSPMNQEAVRNFNAVRNLPPVNNQANQAVRNVWNRIDNTGNQLPPWNRMPPPPSRYPPFPFSPNSAPRQPLNNYPAPRSFAAVLAQAHRQHLPYAGAM